jgi:hypothetical protein
MRHKSMGVQPEYLPIMAEGIVYGMDESLDIKMSNAERESWRTVFAFLVECMKKGMEE